MLERKQQQISKCGPLTSKKKKTRAPLARSVYRHFLEIWLGVRAELQHIHVIWLFSAFMCCS